MKLVNGDYKLILEDGGVKVNKKKANFCILTNARCL